MLIRLITHTTNRWGSLKVILLLTMVAAVFCLHWAWKYYGLPAWPDFREYTRGMNYLWPLINREKKPLLLWSFESKQS